MTSRDPSPPGVTMRLHAVRAVLAVMTLSLVSSVPGLASETPSRNHEEFDAKNFSDPTNVDNPWFAFEPGRRWIWEGTTVDDEGEVLPHRVVITATNLTKVIGGIRCAVTYDLDYEEGELVEAEVAFFAQDDDGNVWRMGEYPEEYDDGEIIAPVWLHGIEGSVAGISMRGNPQVGSPDYSQGWAPSVDFTDRGKVREFVTKDCVPVDCYDNVLVIEETALDEAGAFHLKYWVEGVGNTRVGWGGEGEKTQEVLELVSLEMLDADALAKVQEGALALEKSAFEISPDIYGQSEQMEQSSE